MHQDSTLRLQTIFSDIGSLKMRYLEKISNQQLTIYSNLLVLFVY